MNDLMTKSFLSYVELKKQAQMDIEKTQFSSTDEENLSQFFQEVESMKSEMDDISNLLFDLQKLNEETKSTHSPKVLRGLRDRMDSNMVSVLRKAKILKKMLETLDRSNASNRKLSNEYEEGSTVDRTRVSVTNGLRIKLRDLMNDFQSLREKIVYDHKENLKRRYYNEKGENPSDESIEKMVFGKIEILELNPENKERDEAMMDIQRSLSKLHQVFLDMAILVETQGEEIDNIEKNVANAGKFMSGGTNNLFYAKQMKKNKNKWVYWVLGVGFIILVVCFIATLSS